MFVGQPLHVNALCLCFPEANKGTANTIARGATPRCDEFGPGAAAPAPMRVGEARHGAGYADRQPSVQAE